MKSLFALAALAAIGFAGAAYAGDAKPTPMTDEQMDKVTAGDGATVEHTSTGMSVVTSAGPEHTTGQGGHDFVINYNNSGTHEIEQGSGTYFGGSNGQKVCTGVFAPC